LTETPTKIAAVRSTFSEVSTDIVDVYALSIFSSFDKENISTSSQPLAVGVFEEFRSLHCVCPTVDVEELHSVAIAGES
jgi:hypothetical protein